MKKYYYTSALILFVLYLLSSCAQVGSPTGGPKDTIPPTVLEANPQNYTTNFDKVEFKGVIQFDEYIKLKDIKKQLYLSPPLKENPEFKLKGKKLLIDLKNPVNDSLTYTLNFCNAIVDVNEGNPLINFKYAFSTKSYIDTMSIGGYVKDAYNLTNQEEVWAMVYENYTDSTPLQQKPDYIAKTDTSGYFSIDFIKKGSYRIFALADINNNLIYDQPGEAIAFLDTFITPTVSLQNFIDTLQTDSFIYSDESKTEISDTIQIDSIVSGRRAVFTPRNLYLLSFVEDKDKQYIVNSTRLEKSKCTFIFKKPLLNDSIEIKILDSGVVNIGIIEKFMNKDTVNFWINDTVISNIDTLNFELKYLRKDSIGNSKIISDTINLTYKLPKVAEKKKSRRKPKKDNDNDTIPKKPTLKLNINAINNFDLNNKLIIECPRPVIHADFSKISLYKFEDTLEIKQQIAFIQDSLCIRKFHAEYNVIENTQYKLQLLPSAFQDIMYLENDTIEMKFSTNKSDAYGHLTVNISLLKKNENAIIQLLTTNEDILRKQKISANDSISFVEFSYLKPQKYMLKLIYDTNNNGKWDTGIYLQNIQAEKVIYFKENIEIKAKWENEIKWE